jgi:Flp pilus assembly protein TadG
MKPNSRRSESGQSLVAMILVVTVMVSLAGFALDVGLDFGQKAQLQNGADASALAAATRLPTQSVAEDTAHQYATINGVKATDQLHITISSTLAASDTVTVSIERSVNQTFASLGGLTSVNVAVSASAMVGSAAGLNRFIPFAVLDSVVQPLQHGDALTLTYNGNDPTLGNSLAISFPGDSGGSDFRNSISSGSADTFCATAQSYPGCTTVLQSKPGNMVGPAHQGFDDLISTTSSSCDTFNEVFIPVPGDSTKSQINPYCNPFPPQNVSTSKRLTILPVITSTCAGSCDLPIIRFVLFFVTGVQCNSGSCQVSGLYAENVSGVSGYKLGAYDPNSAFNSVKLTQ